MKRLLSLTLALVMLVLAVPVFALPLTAEADDATLNFYVGPTKTNGMNTLGTLVSSTTVSFKHLPSDEQLAAAGSTLTNADIVGWYTWSCAEDKFISVMDYLLGKRTATETLNFYPVTKDTTTVPYYVNWIDGENQVIWEAADDAIEGKLLGYTGGWSYGSYIGNDYKTFTNIHKPNPAQYPDTWLLVRDDARYQAMGAVYIGNGGSCWSNHKDAAGSLRYQVPKDGTILVKIPHAYAAGTHAVIAKNGTVVWPAAAAGKPAAAPAAQEVADTWYAVPVGSSKVVDRTVRYADGNCVSFELNVAEGDYVEILYMHYAPEAKNGKNEYWYPAVEYTSDTTNIVGVSYYLSPTDSIGSASKGTSVASYERICIKGALFTLPTAEQMATVGLNAEDVIGWYYWDAAENTFREAQEYWSGIIEGRYPAPAGDIYFYPIMKDSTTVPLYLNGDDSIWILGENQPIIENGQLFAYTGGWSYGLWDDTGYQTLDTYKNGGLYAGDNTVNYVNISRNSLFKSDTSNATVLTYHAAVSGKVTVYIPKPYYAMYAAVAKNDAFIWPASLTEKDEAGQYKYAVSNSNAKAVLSAEGSINGKLTDQNTSDVSRTGRYSDKNTIAKFTLDVEAGDCLYFMMYGGNNIWWYPRVVYDTVYTAPSVSANLSVGSSLSVNTAVSVPEGLEGVVESGILVDGEKLEGTTIPVAAKEAGKTITVQPYYVMESGITVYGKKSVITVNKMLEEYIENGDEKVKAAAEATLDYTAAADAYFDDAAAAPEIVEPAGKVAYVEKSRSTGVSEYKGESKVEFRGISLLLNDLVNIKIVIKGELPAGAELQISKSASFDELETLISGSPTEDEKGTKFIMDGISAVNWNTDYYIRVVDAEKNVISDTLCYSVAAYYGRMIDRAEASDKLKAVISSLMNLYEAVSAAN